MSKGAKNRLETTLIPYRDCEGNMLSAVEDYLFTTEEHREKTYTVNSEGVEPIFEKGFDNFPTALRSPDGEIQYLKISAKADEKKYLPTHAGCVDSLDVVFAGAPASGKTTSIIQMCDPEFFNMISVDNEVALWNDFHVKSEAHKRYQEKQDEFKKGVLPERTLMNEDIMPYVFLVQYGTSPNVKHILLKLQDFDGESCLNVGFKSKLLPYDCFFFTIGADDLIAGEKGIGASAQYNRVLEELIPKIKIMRNDDSFQMVIIITKSDLLDQNDEILKDAFENSVCKDKGKLRQITHAKGFDFKAFRKRSDAIEAYLKDTCPQFYRKVKGSVPVNDVSFCMIASIGEKCEKTFTNYNPFCIDEPILSLLASRGMFPVAVQDRPFVNVPPRPSIIDKSVLNRIINSVTRAFRLDEDDEDFDLDV